MIDREKKGRLEKMGTINYKTSKYITMGLNCPDSYDLKQDESFMDEIRQEIENYGGTEEEAIYNYINDSIECDYSNIEFELKKHNFRFFHISIESGYYEGFSLMIELDVDTINDYTDKRQAQKEITEIKQFLIDCAGMGLQACFPGWCTSYFDYKETCNHIMQAIREMRQDVKSTETWYQYNRRLK